MHFISEELEHYVEQHSQNEPELLVKLFRETHQKVLQPRMLSGHFQGRVLSMLPTPDMQHYVWPKGSKKAVRYIPLTSKRNWLSYKRNILIYLTGKIK